MARPTLTVEIIPGCSRLLQFSCCQRRPLHPHCAAAQPGATPNQGPLNLEQFGASIGGPIDKSSTSPISNNRCIPTEIPPFTLSRSLRGFPSSGAGAYPANGLIGARLASCKPFARCRTISGSAPLVRSSAIIPGLFPVAASSSNLLTDLGSDEHGPRRRREGRSPPQ